MRSPGTNKIWRPISLTVGVLFTFRWIIHVIRFIKAGRDPVTTSQFQVGETLSHEVEHLEEASDLQLKETVDTEWNENAPMQLHTSMEVNETLEEHSPLSPPPPQNPVSTSPANPSTPTKRITGNKTVSSTIQEKKELVTRTETS